MGRLVRVGRIAAAFGIKGQVKVVSETDFPERFAPGRRVLVGGQWHEIKHFLDHSGQVVLTFEGISDRNAAEALVGLLLEVPDEDRPKLLKGEYLIRDLVGLHAYTAAGEDLGLVKDVMTAPAQDLLVLESGMVPIVKEFVKKVDLAGGTIQVAPIPGMLGDEE